MIRSWFEKKPDSNADSAAGAPTGPRVPRHSGAWQVLRKRLQAEPGLRVIDCGVTSPTNINYLTSLGHSVFLTDLVTEEAAAAASGSPARAGGGTGWAKARRARSRRWCGRRNRRARPGSAGWRHAVHAVGFDAGHSGWPAGSGSGSKTSSTVPEELPAVERRQDVLQPVLHPPPRCRYSRRPAAAWPASRRGGRRASPASPAAGTPGCRSARGRPAAPRDRRSPRRPGPPSPSATSRSPGSRGACSSRSGAHVAPAP